ncbi:glycosyltransferase [Psychrobacter sp. PAMC 21119]|uniref:glycosyltransferase n=1 Tax=Psychrobacter sp. PAMC 21119 TaxID=1112209 RepID=UPI00028912B3|nr:glycosyltransferase [Psychrobacter sp. PAMC 21119]
MKKMTYVLVRYSLLVENSKGWQIADEDLQTYRDKLFDVKRLKQRLELFEKITLPSLISQTKSPSTDWLEVVIITSQDLPSWNKEELEKIVAKYDWISIDYLPSKKSDTYRFLWKNLDSSQEDVLFSTVRLDDDDALANDFFEKMDPYFKEDNVGFGLSFGNGYAGFYDFESGCYEKVVDYYSPKVAIGLSHFNIYRSSSKSFVSEKIKTIYHARKHVTVDLYIPIILDSRELMFIRTMHNNSDSSNNKAREAKLRKQPATDTKILYDKFPFCKNLYQNNEKNPI